MKVEGGMNWKESEEPVNSKTSSAEKLYLKCKECDKTFNTKSGFIFDLPWSTYDAQTNVH